MTRSTTRSTAVRASIGAAAVVLAVAIAPAGSALPAKAPACVSPKTIKRALGIAVPRPHTKRNAIALICTYGKSVSKQVTIRFRSGVSKASFALDRKAFRLKGLRPKTFRGFGLPAFTSVLGSGASVFSSVAVLKGKTELVVMAPVTLAKEIALVKKLLRTL